jgi:hypothetical protein
MLHKNKAINKNIKKIENVQLEYKKEVSSKVIRYKNFFLTEEQKKVYEDLEQLKKKKFDDEKLISEQHDFQIYNLFTKMSLIDESLFNLGTSISQLSSLYMYQKYSVFVTDSNYTILYGNPAFINFNPWESNQNILFSNIKSLKNDDST